MKALLPRFFALCLCIFALVGCLGGVRLNSISVEVTDVAKGPTSDVLRVTIRYTNENVIPIAVDSTSHKLYVNGKLLGKCLSKAPVGLPPTQTINEVILLHIEDAAFLQSLIGQAGKQTASYKIDSKLFVKSGDENLDTRAINTGAIDLRKLSP